MMTFNEAVVEMAHGNKMFRLMWHMTNGPTYMRAGVEPASPYVMVFLPGSVAIPDPNGEEMEVMLTDSEILAIDWEKYNETV